MSRRIRLDVFLAEKGLSDSREKAKRDILAGWVQVNGETVRTASFTVEGTEHITVKRPKGLFVSRGGDKLRKGLDAFQIDVSGAVAADIGASTGGFTDCLLKAGAAKVYAIDVGYGQLDFSLRRDKRVVVMERTNVRSLIAEQFSDDIAFVSIDLSFISLVKAMPKLKELFPKACGVALIKPQFEALPEEHKKGVVRSKEDHLKILRRTLEALLDMSIVLIGLAYSPVKGPAGNIEFLLHFALSGTGESNREILKRAALVVWEAHRELNGKELSGKFDF